MLSILLGSQLGTVGFLKQENEEWQCADTCGAPMVAFSEGHGSIGQVLPFVVPTRKRGDPRQCVLGG